MLHFREKISLLISKFNSVKFRLLNFAWNFTVKFRSNVNKLKLCKIVVVKEFLKKTSVMEFIIDKLAKYSTYCYTDEYVDQITSSLYTKPSSKPLKIYMTVIKCQRTSKWKKEIQWISLHKHHKLKEIGWDDNLFKSP